MKQTPVVPADGPLLIRIAHERLRDDDDTYCRVLALSGRLGAITRAGLNLLQLAVDNLPFGAPMTDAEMAEANRQMAALWALLPPED